MLTVYRALLPNPPQKKKKNNAKKSKNPKKNWIFLNIFLCFIFTSAVIWVSLKITIISCDSYITFCSRTNLDATTWTFYYVLQLLPKTLAGRYSRALTPL